MDGIKLAGLADLIARDRGAFGRHLVRGDAQMVPVQDSQRLAGLFHLPWGEPFVSPQIIQEEPHVLYGAFPQMKRIILTTWLSAVAVGCLAQTSTQETGLATSPTNVAEQCVSLRKLIIPPKGTIMAEVQAVFGKPTRIPGTGKGESPTEHPVHLYELLMPKDDTRGCALMYGADSYRTILSLDYVDGRVAKATIIHQCVAASRPIYMPGSKEDDAQKNTIAQEQRSALADLLAIKKKYEGKLKDASWNKEESEPKPDGDGPKPAP